MQLLEFGLLSTVKAMLGSTTTTTTTTMLPLLRTVAWGVTEETGTMAYKGCMAALVAAAVG